MYITINKYNCYELFTKYKIEMKTISLNYNEPKKKKKNSFSFYCSITSEINLQ